MKYGHLKPPKSPLLRHVSDPEGELSRLLDGFDVFERQLKYRFQDRSYLLQAMTHASYSPNRLTDCYQRLEFLGDAVLGINLKETCDSSLLSWWERVTNSRHPLNLNLGWFLPPHIPYSWLILQSQIYLPVPFRFAQQSYMVVLLLVSCWFWHLKCQCRSEIIRCEHFFVIKQSVATLS